MNLNEKVRFTINNEEKTGTIICIDKTSIEYPDITTYDILGDDGILYKKITEVY